MAKISGIAVVWIIVFALSLFGITINLETLSHIGGIVGVVAALFFAYLGHRKKLLNTGFTAFRTQYRQEMDDFKNNILSNVNLFRKMMDKNDERHSKTLDRIVELYEGTHNSVKDQANTCKLIRVERAGDKKVEDAWKTNMKKELHQVQEDVAHMKKVINHVK